jgi:hypothetical protein
MKNYDDNDYLDGPYPHPSAQNTYDSEDCYGQPYDWSLARQNSHPFNPGFQHRLPEQPMCAIDADVSNPPSPA